MSVVPEREDQPIPSGYASNRDHQDGLCAGRVAEVVEQGYCSGRHLVAVARARGAVAGRDVVDGREAVHVGLRVDALGAPVVYVGACSTTEVLDAGVAVHENGVLHGARGEGVERLAQSWRASAEYRRGIGRCTVPAELWPVSLSEV